MKWKRINTVPLKEFTKIFKGKGVESLEFGDFYTKKKNELVDLINGRRGKDILKTGRYGYIDLNSFLNIASRFTEVHKDVIESVLGKNNLKWNDRNEFWNVYAPKLKTVIFRGLQVHPELLTGSGFFKITVYILPEWEVELRYIKQLITGLAFLKDFYIEIPQPEFRNALTEYVLGKDIPLHLCYDPDISSTLYPITFFVGQEGRPEIKMNMGTIIYDLFPKRFSYLLSL